ncbi:unnamed protein product [Prorocentrum cordatum]|uniref:RNA-directed RNA polymerase n=1 Tax=Prorocentrum cordatum TaxID=2364126 RepID=A0ABN9TYP1_9DINO|nr:unnamed protein product [Polarella glacialis]
MKKIPRLNRNQLRMRRQFDVAWYLAAWSFLSEIWAIQIIDSAPADAVREYHRDIIPKTDIETRPTKCKFSGYDGKPAPGIGKIMGGERKPSLMRVGLFVTESGHYIMPVDNVSTKEDVDQQCLNGRVMNRINWCISFKPSAAASRTPTADFRQEHTPLDAGTGNYHHFSDSEQDIISQLQNLTSSIQNLQQQIKPHGDSNGKFSATENAGHQKCQHLLKSPRYGWNMNLVDHQQIIDTFCKCSRVWSKFFSPERAPWSVASAAADPKVKTVARMMDKSSLQLISDTCYRTKEDSADYIIENPGKRCIWDGSPFEDLMDDGRFYQKLHDQCRHGLRDSEGDKASCEGDAADQPSISKMLAIEPSFDLQRFKHQLEEAATEQARYPIQRELAGTDPNEGQRAATGLVESYIRRIKAIALNNKVDAKRDGLGIPDESLVYGATMSQNLLLNYSGSTLAKALPGFTPRDFYDGQASTVTSVRGALVISPDTCESNARDEWGIKIDGIIYGKCARRLFDVSGASFGRQVIRDCTKRSQHIARDINPSRQVLDISATIPGTKDTDACSIVFCAFNAAPENAETEKYVLPDLSDISSIGNDPGDGSPAEKDTIECDHAPEKSTVKYDEFPDRHWISACMATEELDEHQRIMMNMAQGLSYETLHRTAKRMGIEVREQREVHLTPPASVWSGIQSVFDENFFMWIKEGNIMMVWTVHVDDIIVLARMVHPCWSMAEMEKRVGEIKRHQLLFIHMGVSYEQLGPRHVFIHQESFTDSFKQIFIELALKGKTENGCNPKHQHDLRSALCSLLWFCQTREDIYCEVVQLQQPVRMANAGHLKQASLLIDRAQRNKKMAGLHFAPLRYPARPGDTWPDMAVVHSVRVDFGGMGEKAVKTASLRGKWWDGKVVAPPCFGKVRCDVDGREYDMEEADVRPRVHADEPPSAAERRFADGGGAESRRRGGWGDEAPPARQVPSKWPAEEKFPAAPEVLEPGAPRAPSGVMTTGQVRAMMDAKAAFPAQPPPAGGCWADSMAMGVATSKASPPSFSPPPGRPPPMPTPPPRPSSAIGRLELDVRAVGSSTKGP